MPVLLVRHAHAVPRRRWDGDDARRPLSGTGREQAGSLVDALAPWPVTRVLTSPALRCADTVAPLAAARDLAVAEDPALAEGSTAGPALVLALAGGDATVVACTHGDVVGDVLDALAEGGADLGDAVRCAKGSTWVIKADGAGAVTGRYLRPPL